MPEKKLHLIYTEREGKIEPRRKKVKLESFLVGKNAPVVLICAGGGYKYVSNSNEGYPYAEKCNEKGLNAFVLTYCVGMSARYPNPLEDVARAIQYIKANAEKLCIDANKIILMGSSAGAHLVSLFAVQYERFESDYLGVEYSLKPQGLILIYPVITMGALTHRGTRRRILGFLSGSPEQNAASIEKQATEDFPPTFLWHCEDDICVDYHNSILLADTLEKYGVPHELKLYHKGGHGIGLAKGKEAEGWIDLAFAFMQREVL